MESALTSYRVAALRNVSANSLFAGSGVFASNLAVHHAHAARKALERDGVLNRETTALRSAASVQTFDNLAIVVVHMALVVGIEAAQVAQGKGAAALSSIERAILQSEQTLRALEEVSIFARLAQLVVALDGFLRLVDIDTLDFGKQLIDGVGLQAAAVSDSVVDIFLGTHIDAQAGSGVFRKLLFTIEARNAVGSREVLSCSGQLASKNW